MRPGQRHLYRVSSSLPNTGTSLHPAVCLTCATSSGVAMTDERWGIGSSSSKNNPINRNEWHDHYESSVDDVDHKEHRQEKQKDKKDGKSKSKNISSEVSFDFCFRYYYYI